MKIPQFLYVSAPYRTVAIMSALSAFAPGASATTFDYIGGASGSTTSPVSGNWTTAASWSGGTAPTSSLDNILTFGGSGSGTYTSTYSTAAFSLNQLTLNSSSSGVSKISSNASTGVLNFVNNTAATGPQIVQSGSGAFLIGETFSLNGITLANTLTISGTGTGSVGLTTNISGAGGIIMSGAGVLKLSGNNTYTGGVTINSGTVDAGYGNGNRLGTGALTLAGGKLSLTDDTARNWNQSSVAVTGNTTLVSNRVTAGAGVIQTINGAVSMGANTLTVQAGDLVTSGTAGVKLGSTMTLTGNATLSVGAGAILQVNEVAATAFSLTKDGEGEVSLLNTARHTGGTIINAGKLTVGNNDILGLFAPITVNGGTLDYGSFRAYAGVVTLAGGSITGTTSFLQGTSYDLRSGSISKILTGDNVVATKSTSGTVRLSGVNTYTGATNINAGTLLVNGSLHASSAVALNAAATLGGTGTVFGTVTTGGATSIISPGDSSAAAFTVGALNATAGATFNFDLGTTSDQLAITGLFTGSTGTEGLMFNFSNAGGLAANTIYTLVTFGSSSGLDVTDFTSGSIAAGFVLDGTFGTGGFAISGNSVQVRFATASIIPEPSAAALLAAVFAATTVVCGRRRRGQ